MRRLNGWLALAIVWPIALRDLEGWVGPLGFSRLLPGLALASVLAVVLWPPLRRASTPWLMLPVVTAWGAAKLVLGQPISGVLPVAVTEVVALALSVLLARRLGEGLDEFRRGVGQLLVRHLPDPALGFEAGQGVMYREVRRARRREHPLCLLALDVEGGDAEHLRSPLLEEVQRDHLRGYASARLAEILARETQEGDIIVRHQDHLLTLLPETRRADALRVADRLRRRVAERLGLELRVGLSSFPDQELTFDELLERAEAEMRASRPAGGRAAPAAGEAGSAPLPAETAALASHGTPSLS
jgi:hypothetical protein